MSQKKIDYYELTFDEEKEVAVKMWQFIKKWYVKHPDTYMHPMHLKDEFCTYYYEKTGQLINWEAHCILCDIFYEDACNGCTLYKKDDMFCSDYFKLSDADFPFHMRPSVCDRIIEAIKSYEE